MNKSRPVIDREIQVINIGIDRFAEDLMEAGVPVIQMDWRPPAGGNKRLIEMLDRLNDESGSTRNDEDKTNK